MKRLSVALGRVALDAPDGHERAEGFGTEPSPRRLGRKVGVEVLDLLLSLRPRQRNIEVRVSQIAFVFWYLVFQNQVVSVGVPGQLRDREVVLVHVVAVMGEDDVGRGRPLELLEEVLQGGLDARKVALAERLDDDRRLDGAIQDHLRARPGLRLALGRRRKDDPVYGAITFPEQPRQRPGAT